MTTHRVESLTVLLSTIEEALDWEFDREEFEDRLRMQKYVLFSDAFGVDTPYSYGIHLHGPYSPTLAEDYYDEDFDRLRTEAPATADLDVDGFRELLRGRSTDWLEYAATIKRLHERVDENAFGKYDEVIERTCDLKDISVERADEIYDELLRRGVVA